MKAIYSLTLCLLLALSACGPSEDHASDRELPGRDAGSVASDRDGSSQAIDGGGAEDAGSPASDASDARLATGRTCTAASECESGFCADGVCCDVACAGACRSCAQTGKVGVCSPIKNGDDDLCSGASTCDGQGACRRRQGMACAGSADCASGSCVDGVCCQTSACGKCQSCSVPGSEGVCAPVAKFVDDPNSECTNLLTCNGLGECRTKSGQSCTEGAQCASLTCVDGVCCDQTCTGTCYSCNQPQSPGICTPIDGAEDLTATTTCSGVGICTTAGGAPACKGKNGSLFCASNADCASGNCRTVRVPPDPADPYDLGYTFTRCE